MNAGWERGWGGGVEGGWKREWGGCGVRTRCYAAAMSASVLLLCLNPVAVCDRLCIRRLV
jgi:hypothetical protein